MKVRNVSLIMTILFLAAVIATAGYAYFSAEISLNGNIEAIISTAGTKPTFTSAVNGNINLTVNVQDLTDNNIGNAVANSNSTINVSLLAGSDNGNVTCTYDIEFVWDGEPYNATTTLPTSSVQTEAQETDIQNQQYKFELSFQGNSSSSDSGASEASKKLDEVNLDKLNWKEGKDKKIATVINGATISNSSEKDATNVTWTFTLKFYVLPTPQNKLLKKDFKGHLVVTNVVC